MHWVKVVPEPFGLDVEQLSKQQVLQKVWNKVHRPKRGCKHYCNKLWSLRKAFSPTLCTTIPVFMVVEETETKHNNDASDKENVPPTDAARGKGKAKAMDKPKAKGKAKRKCIPCKDKGQAYAS